MKVLCVIPARYASTRLPGKPLSLIAGKPMIQHVYERACQAKLPDEVVVATDNELVKKAVDSFGGKAMMTSPDHHDYGMLEMQYINERASSLKAVAMVTTAKDAVKIPTEFIYSAREIPLYILNMDICITEGMDKFKEYIDHAIKKELDKK